MTMNWAAFEAAEPEFSTAVRRRFGRFRHHVLATLRADGSPRVTPLEVSFHFGELWLGMMPGSRKAQDLFRDPRCAIQANPGPDTAPEGGDVRVGGRAVEIDDPAVIRRFVAVVEPPEPFHLFRVEIEEIVHTQIDGEALVLRVWNPGGPVRTLVA